MAKLQNIERGEWFRGSRHLIQDTIYTDATEATAENITGWAIEYEVRRSEDAADTMFTLTTAGGDITLTTPASGILDVVVPAANSAQLRPGKYWYAIRRTDSGSEDMLTYGYVWLTGAAAR